MKTSWRALEAGLVKVKDEDDELDDLSAFLSHAALEAGEGQTKDSQNCAQLMTLHSAKGLEFPLVFICGVEEGLFPSDRSLEEPGRLEEERQPPRGESGDVV